jgi:hypothetical protein
MTIFNLINNNKTLNQKDLLLGFSMVLLTFLTTSCDEEFFSQVVEVEVPEHESLTVLNALWTSQDTLLELLVSNSLSILDQEDFTVPDDADVQLFKNDNLVGAFILNNESFKYEILLNDPLGNASGTYKIEAKVTGYNPISVEQTMPGLVEIENATFEKEGAVDPTGEKVDEYTVTFNDPPGVENYYLVQAFQIAIYVQAPGDTIFSREHIYLDSNDPTANYSELGLIFTDKAFDGNEYTMRAWDYGWWNEGGDVEIQLISLTKDKYLYLKSKEDYYNSVDNPFAQPATVHNNIVNGYGIFGLGAVDIEIIEK